MSNKVEFDPEYFKLAIALSLGEIEFEKYKKERHLKTRTKLKEIKELATTRPFLYNNYLNNLPHEYRMKAIKEVHDLTNDIIRYMRPWKNFEQKHFSGQVNKYLSGNYDVKNGNSFYLYALAIILDTPTEYFIYDNIDSEKVNLNTFTEYLNAASVSSYREIVINTMERPLFRMIQGYKVVNKTTLYELIDFVRLDKRVEFFSFEIYIQKRNIINRELVDSIRSFFDGTIKYIFLSNPLLRDAYKLSFYGVYDQKKEHLMELDSYIRNIKRCKLNEEIYT
jgi:DNA-binding protein Fis